MRITARQLRQIIKEELTRGIREADETSADVVAMPSAPKKRGLFGSRETSADESAWNAEWTTLSQGEKDVFVAGVKNDPSFPTVVGVAVKNEDFDIKRFMDFLQMPYPQGGSQVFEALVGGSTARGLPLAQVVRQFAGKFSNNDQRLARLGKLGISVVSGEGTRLDRLVYDNAPLVAALERIYVGEALYHDEYRGGLKPPRPSEAPHMAEFVAAALGI
jgi:hypothetical protein